MIILNKKSFVRFKGFTFVELLVVVCVITCVIAVMLPMLQQIKRSYQAVLCGSNIKQLYLSMSVYDQENSSFPYGFDGTRAEPPSQGYAGNPAYDKMGWWWFDHLIEDNISIDFDWERSFYSCPSRRLATPMFKANVLCGNYGVNQSIFISHTDKVATETPLSLAYIEHPSKALVIMDSGYSIINWQHAADKPPYPLDKQRIEDTA